MSIKKNICDAFDDGDVELIVHGCNCFTNMNGGLAKEIKIRYPQCYEEDIKFDKKFTNKKDKLGQISICEIDNKYIVNASHNIIITKRINF